MNKLTRGDKLGKLSAAALNRLPDLIAAHDRGNSSQGDSDSGTSARDGIVLISNKTGSSLPAFSVVGLDAAVFSPAESPTVFQQVLAFDAKVPTGGEQISGSPTTNYRGKFAILLEPAPAGASKATAALVIGVTAARLLVTDEAHEWADIDPGQTGQLRSGETGTAQILWKESGSGAKWAIVRLGTRQGDELLRFELQSTLPLGMTATAKRVEFNGAAYAVTGDEFFVGDFTKTPGSWRGVAGHRGWCLKMPDSGIREIVWMETVAQFIEFTALENLGATAAGEMSVTVEAWYAGKQPTTTPLRVTDPRGLFAHAKTGAKGKAWYNAKLDKYVIVECQTKAGRIEVEIQAALDSEGETTVDVLDFSGSQQDVQHPGDEVTVHDPQDHFPLIQPGGKGIALLDAIADEYNLVLCDTQAGIVEVTLAGPFVDGVATGEVTAYYGSQQDWQSPPGVGSTISVDVYDEQDCFPRTRGGAKCKAFLDVKANKYRAFWCEQIALCGYATLDATMDSGGVTFTDFTPISPSPFNLAPDPLPTAGLNPFLHHGMSGDQILVQWDQSQTDWIVTDVEKVEVKILVKVAGTGYLRLDGDQLQGYTLTAAVERSEDPAWENLLQTVEECAET